MHPTIGLPVGPRGRKGLIPRIGHNLKYPLRCLLSFGSKRPQPRMRSFFHGVDAKGWQIHLYKWSFPCQHDNIAFCCCIRRKAELGALYHNCQTGIIFDSPSQKWVTGNQKKPSIATMPWRLALRTIRSKDSACDQRK